MEVLYYKHRKQTRKATGGMEMKSELYINYESGVRMGVPCSTARFAYETAFRIIRRLRCVKSAEMVTGGTIFKMIAREYLGGRYAAIYRGDGSIVSAWVLKGK